MAGERTSFRKPAQYWPAKVMQPSFKGIPFDVDDDVRAGGRRLAVHEYPASEFWDTEDLGRAAQRIRVAAYVHGDDCHLQAERLMAACSSPGAGTLFLPLRPPAAARCLTAFSTFASDEMGRIGFELEFVLESPFPGGLVSAILLAGFVVEATASAAAVLGSRFDLSFNALMRRFSPLSPVPAVARDAAAGTIRLAAAEIEETARVLAFSDRAAAAEFGHLVRTMQENAVVLAYRGIVGDRIDRAAYVAGERAAESGLSATIAAALDALARAAADPAALAAAMARLASFRAPAIATLFDCLSVRAEKTLTAEVAALVRRLALAGRAAATVRIAYGSRAEAVAARTAIAAAFSAELADCDDAEAAAALAAVRDAAVTYLSRAGAELPQTVVATVGRSLPAAVLATALYGDAGRDAELVARNRAAHPLYMPTTVEALRPDGF